MTDSWTLWSWSCQGLKTVPGIISIELAFKHHEQQIESISVCFSRHFVYLAPG